MRGAVRLGKETRWSDNVARMADNLCRDPMKASKTAAEVEVMPTCACGGAVSCEEKANHLNRIVTKSDVDCENCVRAPASVELPTNILRGTLSQSKNVD